MDPNPTIDPITSFHPGTSGKQVTILRRLPYHFPYFIGVVHPITLFLHVQPQKKKKTFCYKPQQLSPHLKNSKSLKRPPIFFLRSPGTPFFSDHFHRLGQVLW